MTACLAALGRPDIQSVAFLGDLLDTIIDGLDVVLNLNRTRLDQVHQGSTALPYNFINPIGVNGAYFYAKLSYIF